ncbi:MAG: toll/interleukin-1 receptor domain-containing protein [Candidatus Sulfotelmatobacter sp.]
MGDARARGVAEGKVVPGSVLAVQVHSPDLDVSRPVRPFTWNGQETWESFDCSLRAGIDRYFVTGSAIMTLYGLLIAEVRFELYVAKELEPTPQDVSSGVNSPSTAFASYASADRIEVMRSVQGISKGAPHLEIFVDVDALRSADDWKEKISAYISTSDILYLFWSTAASQSKWVDSEWRMGVSQKGVRFIDPFPLESPSVVPPPAELSSLHFNDRYLIHILAQQQIDLLKSHGPTQTSG